MKARLLAFVAALALASGALAQGKPAQGKPVLIGAVLSQTGYLDDLGRSMRNALQLWEEQVNASGGLLGRPVELRLYDDGSDALRNTALYELLIKDDGAELLIGGTGSAATSMGAAVAERNRRVMVNATGTSPSIHKRVYRYLFQVPPPSDTVAAGVPQLAAKFGLKSLLVTARDEKTAQPLIELLRADAPKAGVAIGPSVYYILDAYKGLATFARAFAASGADVLVTPASPRDAAEIMRGFKAAGTLPKLFVARGATDPEFIRQVGMDAEYSVGFSSYETRLPTPGNAEFVKAYSAKYKAAPDFPAACSWAAGKVIEAAVAKAGSLEQEKLRTAFQSLETGTLLGGYKVDAFGAQLAAQSFLVQILKGRREVVWPEAWRSAAPVVPMPGWDRRKPG
jgi:branched-chain amino acid transport system substrate-binding protein